LFEQGEFLKICLSNSPLFSSLILQCPQNRKMGFIETNWIIIAVVACVIGFVITYLIMKNKPEMAKQIGEAIKEDVELEGESDGEGEEEEL